MKVYWLRAWDNPDSVWVSVEVAEGRYEAQIPYDQDGDILMQTHHMSQQSIDDAIARKQWICEKVVDSTQVMY